MFARALKESLGHWPLLAAALVASMAAAALWGINIGAILPIMESTLQGISLQDWNRGHIAESQATVASLNSKIAALEHGPAAHSASTDSDSRQLRSLQVLLATAETNLHWYQRIQPWLDRLLPTKPFTTVLLIVCLVMISTTVKQILTMVDTVLVSYVSLSIAREMRMRIFDKALALDRQGFNNLGTSGFSTHILQTTEMLATGLANFFGGAFNEPMRVIVCLGGAMFVSWRLTLASLICAPAVLYLVGKLSRKVRSTSRSFLNRSRGSQHVMLEVFGSLQTVQAYSMEGFESDRFRVTTKEMRRSALWAAYYNALANPLTEVFGIAMLCTALAVTSYLILNRATSVFGIKLTSEPLTVPSMMLLFGFLIGAADPLRKLSGVITNINMGMMAADLLYPMLDSQSRIVDPPEPKSVAKPHGRLEFRNVGFSYDGSHYVLRNVDLTVPFGEHLAVVGPNGGGKSTLINLICRFFDPQEGEIAFDGVSLKDMAVSDVRNRIALVTQQTELFNETILHNIRYGCWNATDEQVMEAAKRAKAHDFISSFPDGYETVVGPNGQRLSGGQRQRICLARAILRNSEILILDEATSQIDADSERLIHDALLEIGRDRTMIMISHRQSTLELADRVVEIDHGQLTVRPQSRAA
jgi:subfamily B ATP-binding cassette protein MsbA